ncbi:MAG: NUDIX hydrolase [Firmicutes bacterium]|nr:NUDIX hydrolase [Bacillota bacterium]
MEKKSLQELRKLLEELKTVKKTLVSKSEVYKPYIKIIDGIEYISIEDLTKGQFVTNERYICTLNNGEDIIREKIKKAKKDGSAVIVIPVTKDNEVIVTVEPRVFTEKTVGVGFPAGYIEDGEKPEVAALRELQEEIGVIPEKLIPLASFYQDEGISAAKNTAYLALGCTEGYEKNPDEGEFVEYFKCSFNEVLELQQDGYIEGSNSVIAIEKAKQYFTKTGKVKRYK